MMPLWWMLRSIQGANGAGGGIEQRQYQPPPAFGHPDNGYDAYDPYDDEETKRRANNAGTSSLLAGLLNSYMNRGQGLGDAISSSSTARQGVYDRAREEHRLRTADERQRSQDSLDREWRRKQMENVDVDNELRRKQLTEAEAERARIAGNRQRAVEQAPNLYSQIVAEFGENSPEARQGKAIIGAQGDDVLDDLRDIYSKGVTARERREEQKRADARAARDDARADEYLNVARANSTKRSDSGSDGTPKQPTTAQFANDVEQEIDRLVGGKMYEFLPPDKRAEAREKVRNTAEQTVQRRYKAYNDSTGDVDGVGEAATPVDPKAGARAIVDRWEYSLTDSGVEGVPRRRGAAPSSNLDTDPGYTSAVRSAAAAKGFDVAAARRDGVTWAEIRRELGLLR